jgi:hypothetical protein
MNTNILPLEKDQIEKLIKNRMEKKPDLFDVSEVDYTIDYKNSTVKEKKALTYLSTLKIKSELQIDYSIPVEERMDLLSFYLDEMKLVYNKSLIDCICAMLLEEKGVNVEGDLFLSKEERVLFKEKWGEVFAPWIQFFDNLVPCLPFTHILYRESVMEGLIKDDKVEIIDDHIYLGLNFVYVILQHGFIEFYQSLCKPKDKLTYFQTQMEQSLFAGKSLSQIMAMKDVPVFVYLAAFFNSCEGKDDFSGIFGEVA